MTTDIPDCRTPGRHREHSPGAPACISSHWLIVPRNTLVVSLVTPQAEKEEHKE